MLRGKGVSVPIICPICEIDIEQLLHIFFYCAFARRCWSKIGLALDIDMSEVETAPEELIG